MRQPWLKKTDVQEGKHYISHRQCDFRSHSLPSFSFVVDVTVGAWSEVGYVNPRVVKTGHPAGPV